MPSLHAYIRDAFPLARFSFFNRHCIAKYLALTRFPGAAFDSFHQRNCRCCEGAAISDVATPPSASRPKVFFLRCFLLYTTTSALPLKLSSESVNRYVEVERIRDQREVTLPFVARS